MLMPLTLLLSVRTSLDVGVADVNAILASAAVGSDNIYACLRHRPVRGPTGHWRHRKGLPRPALPPRDALLRPRHDGGVYDVLILALNLVHLMLHMCCVLYLWI